MQAAKDDIAAIRRFTRFYTRQIDVLNEGLLRSSFSLTEARVLYELAQAGGLTAADLRRQLGLDPGYLSRILKTFEAAGLLLRSASPSDGREFVLALTPGGRDAFAKLDAASHEQIAALIRPLPAEGRRRLVAAAREVERLLGGDASPDVAVTLRPHRVGDIGWIAHRQGLLYAQEYGWDATFEALVAEIAAAFVKSFDPAHESCWIADRDGEVLGSVFLVRQSDEIAKLRLLYVEPAARGLGIGRRLVAECIARARACGYGTLTLWTNDVLDAARRIYQEAGFTLVAEERHRSFGRDLVGQNWDLAL